MSAARELHVYLSTFFARKPLGITFNVLQVRRKEISLDRRIMVFAVRYDDIGAMPGNKLILKTLKLKTVYRRKRENVYPQTFRQLRLHQ